MALVLSQPLATAGGPCVLRGMCNLEFSGGGEGWRGITRVDLWEGTHVMYASMLAKREVWNVFCCDF